MCANCSRFDHIELDGPVMAIQGQGMLRQGPSRGPTQQGRPNYLGTYPNYYNALVFNNPSQNAGFRRNKLKLNQKMAGFLKDKSERRHPDGCLVCRPVCP